jgi:hypothetical protein
MVGLTELGEHAYKVEAIHNRLLEEEHAVTPAVIAMIGVAEAEFRGWIARLKQTGHVNADPRNSLPRSLPSRRSFRWKANRFLTSRSRRLPRSLQASRYPRSKKRRPRRPNCRS